MSKKDKLYCFTVISCSFIAVLVMAYFYYPHGKSTFEPYRTEMPEERLENKIDINRASVGNLQCLEGIGEEKALRIVAYREEHGPFRSADELTLVEGIGETIVSKNRDIIYVEGESVSYDPS